MANLEPRLRVQLENWVRKWKRLQRVLRRKGEWVLCCSNTAGFHDQRGSVNDFEEGKTPEAQLGSFCSSFMLEVPEISARVHAKHSFYRRASPQPLAPAIWSKSCTSLDRMPAAQETQGTRLAGSFSAVLTFTAVLRQNENSKAEF